jgi:hypothetical protein
MIQRIQTVWLLLAGICMWLCFKFPFFTGTRMVNAVKEDVRVLANSSFIGMVLSLTFLIGSVVLIFLYKKRTLQFRLNLLLILIGLVNGYVLYTNSRGLSNGTYSISAVFPVFAIGFAISAARCIWHDEKKIRSLNSNRLR